jgi:hypothetical protein
MKRYSILFFFIIGLAQWSFPQSEFLRRGQNGIEGGVGLSTNNEAQGLSFFTGYSYHGFINANLLYVKTNGGLDQGGLLSPSITYYPIKQEDGKKKPTLGISLGFVRYHSKTTETVVVPDTVSYTWRSYDRVTELTVDALKLGVTAQSRTGRWRVLFFQPLLGASVSMSHTGWEFALHGGVSIGARVIRGPLLILTPSIESQSGLTTWLLTFAVIY